MNRVLGSLLAALAATAAAPGCAVYPGTARPADYEDLRREEGWILLEGVPEVRQANRNDCGAAALAMVLGRWGLPAELGALETECSVPGTEGLLAAALRDAARRRGLSAFLFAGTVADLDHELRRGRPVVVGLAKDDGDAVTAHFEVVIGLHPGRGRIAALDPGIGLTCDSIAGFEGEWTQTKCVTLVVFKPEAEAAPAAIGATVTRGGR